MKSLLNFSDFSVNEALKNISSDWPANWKGMPEWASLQEMGFVDSTTVQMERNGSILLTNPQLPIYPGGIVLQKSGYIRDKLATSGFIKSYKREFTLKEMFDYLIARFSKEASKLSKTSSESGLPASTVAFLDAVTRKGWKWNTKTQRTDVNGNVRLSKIKNIPEGIRFGEISGNFECAHCGLTNLEIAPTSVGYSFDIGGNPIESLEGCPDYVGGNFICDDTKIKDMKGCPPTVNGIISAMSCNRLESLEGIPLNIMGLRTDYFQIYIAGKPQQNAVYSDLVNDGKVVVVRHALLTLINDPEKNPNFYAEDHYIDDYHFTTRWTVLNNSQKVKGVKLINSVLDDKYLDEYFTKNPLKLYVLDNFPEVKKGVLARTGMRDVSKIGRNLDFGMT